YSRHVKSGDPGTVLLLTAPVQRRVAAAATTAHKLLEASPIAAGALGGQFRRVSRPLGPIGRRQGRSRLGATTPAIDATNKGKLSPAPPPPRPSGMVTPTSAGKGIVPSQAPPKTSPAFQDYLRRTALRDGNLSPDLISKLAPLPAFKLTELRTGTHPWQLALKAL